MPSPASAAAASSRVPRSRFTRMSSGASCSMAPNSAPSAAPNRAESDGRSQSGTSNRTASGIAGWSSVWPASRSAAAASRSSIGAGPYCPPE